jgi:hypothetical protein
MDDYLFKLGYGQSFDYKFVEHLLNVREILCQLPDWIDSLCIINNVNAGRVLPEIFSLPREERNAALDKYFEKENSEPEENIIQQVDGIESKFEYSENGIRIDIDAINALDEDEFPIVILDSKRGQLPITHAEYEKFNSLLASNNNKPNKSVDLFIDQLWTNKIAV